MVVSCGPVPDQKMSSAFCCDTLMAC